MFDRESHVLNYGRGARTGLAAWGAVRRAIPKRRRSRIQSVVSSALSDEALLSGLAAGDADAATAFTRRFQARVYGLVLTIVRDERTAEDVAQETFVRAWKHAHTYDPRRGRVATWLLAIARNLAIDVIRVKTAEPLDPDLVASKLLQAGGRRPRRPGLPTGRARSRARRHRRTAVGTAACPVPRGLPGTYGPGHSGVRGDPAGDRQDPHPGRDAQAARFTGDQE
jgi:RNA polymerase sigma factor (sigma-70 family)